MFVQVIQGQVADPAQVHAAFDRWAQELAPTATGWLGSTAGVTADGTLVALTRFESEEAAQQNSHRPEQDRWWTDTSSLLSGPAEFHNCKDVVVDLAGEPDQARFVQVIQGRSSDPARGREFMNEHSKEWAEFRPDIIGSMEADEDDGAYTMALYFRSEAEAREGERKEPPPELKAQMDEMNSLNVGEPHFFDLKDPWLYSPRSN